MHRLQAFRYTLIPTGTAVPDAPLRGLVLVCLQPDAGAAESPFRISGDREVEGGEDIKRSPRKSGEWVGLSTRFRMCSYRVPKMPVTVAKGNARTSVHARRRAQPLRGPSHSLPRSSLQRALTVTKKRPDSHGSGARASGRRLC